MDIEKRRFQTSFPNLSRELEQEPQSVEISDVRSGGSSCEKVSSKTFAGYEPNVIDFIRRCDNEQQAKEIIDYLEKRQEVNSVQSKKLTKQLEEKGVRSFGPKKQTDYYSREALV